MELAGIDHRDDHKYLDSERFKVLPFGPGDISCFDTEWIVKRAVRLKPPVVVSCFCFMRLIK